MVIRRDGRDSSQATRTRRRDWWIFWIVITSSLVCWIISLFIGRTERNLVMNAKSDSRVDQAQGRYEPVKGEKNTSIYTLLIKALQASDIGTPTLTYLLLERPKLLGEIVKVLLPYQDLFTAIREVEIGNADIRIEGGPYQLTYMCRSQFCQEIFVRQIFHPSDDEVILPVTAQVIVIATWEYFGAKNDEERAKIHHVGYKGLCNSNQHIKTRADAYWEHVKNIMENIEEKRVAYKSVAELNRGE